MMGMIVCLVFLMVSLALISGWVISTIWMGLDYSKHRSDNGMMWILVNVFSPYVGLIGYLLNKKMNSTQYKNHIRTQEMNY